eukprot:8844113-Pyramimonas_sp.AAC.1
MRARCCIAHVTRGLFLSAGQGFGLLCGVRRAMSKSIRTWRHVPPFSSITNMQNLGLNGWSHKRVPPS